jgi:hypothetical protein
VLTVVSSEAQTDTFKYNREIKGVTDEWHKLELPVDVISRSKRNLGDLRVLDINSNGDTLEAPYLVELDKPLSTRIEVPVTIINRATKNGSYFYTLKPSKLGNLNKVDLSFGNANFDWKVQLEGSQNNNEWFSILDDYRILSINNAQTNYKYTSLVFPNSEYAYYRIKIVTEDKPNLTTASVSMNKSNNAKLNLYPVKSVSKSIDKDRKTSIFDLTLTESSPISSLSLVSKNGDIDYVRPVSIKVLKDSFKTEKGWKYNYQTLYSGTFSSFEANNYTFQERIATKLRVEILNGDNQPIDADVVNIAGYKRNLTARFTNAKANSNYYLAYGNQNKFSPSYDLMLFRERIPTEMGMIELGPIEYVTAAPFKEPEEDKKLWLWAIMGVVMIVLGLFTLKMMKNS